MRDLDALRRYYGEVPSERACEDARERAEAQLSVLIEREREQAKRSAPRLPRSVARWLQVRSTLTRAPRWVAACILVLLVTAMSVPGSRATLLNILESIFRGGDVGRVVTNDQLPRIFGNDVEGNVIARAGPKKLVVIRNPGGVSTGGRPMLCYALDAGAEATCITKSGYRSQLAENPVGHNLLISAPGVQTRFAYGLTASDVRSVEVEYESGSPSVGAAERGGYVIEVDQSRRATELVGLDDQGDPIASIEFQTTLPAGSTADELLHPPHGQRAPLLGPGPLPAAPATEAAPPPDVAPEADHLKVALEPRPGPQDPDGIRFRVPCNIDCRVTVTGAGRTSQGDSIKLQPCGGAAGVGEARDYVWTCTLTPGSQKAWGMDSGTGLLTLKVEARSVIPGQGLRPTAPVLEDVDSIEVTLAGRIDNR